MNCRNLTGVLTVDCLRLPAAAWSTCVAQERAIGGGGGRGRGRGSRGEREGGREEEKKGEGGEEGQRKGERGRKIGEVVLKKILTALASQKAKPYTVLPYWL